MQFEASRLEGLEHRTDAQSAPEVFFTPIITPESLVAAYHALGRKPEGKTAIKVHSGESEKSNNLNPSLVKDLVQEIGGTLVECATAYDGNRETPEKSLATFKKHGYADLAPIQIMDMGGEIEIPTLDAVAKIKIPAETQSGRVFRLRGKGIKGVRSHTHGDLMCHVVVETPVNLTERQKELLRELEESSKDNSAKHNPRSKSWMDKVKEFFGD